MRKKCFWLMVLVVLCLLPTQLFAGISGDPIKNYDLPMLITNAGQGPGGKMARLLVSQTKTIILDQDYFYESEPERAELTCRKYSCLMVVIGSTDKGLGASGITIDDECERLERVVKVAEEIKLPIVAVLLEQDKRQPGIPTNANERCIDLICPHAEWMIVVSGGNKDGRFDELKKKYNIPLTIIDNSLDFTALSKQIFNR